MNKSEGLCETLADVLCGCAQILDVVKGEWADSWGEWDQSVRDGITAQLKTIYAHQATDGNLAREIIDFILAVLQNSEITPSAEAHVADMIRISRSSR